MAQTLINLKKTIKLGHIIIQQLQKGVVNGPPKNESLGKFYPSLGILQYLLMGLGVSDFVSVGHIFLSWARISRCQSLRVWDLPFATPAKWLGSEVFLQSIN